MSQTVFEPMSRSIDVDRNNNMTTSRIHNTQQQQQKHQQKKHHCNPHYQLSLPRRILLTGVAGFISGHLAERIMLDMIDDKNNNDINSSNDDDVTTIVGIDNLNDYYDRRLKLRTLEILHETATKVGSSRRQGNQSKQSDIVDSGKDGNEDGCCCASSTSTSSVFQFRAIDLRNSEEVDRIFREDGPFDCIIHLAAQPGVRYSIQHPVDCVQNNVIGTLNLLQCASQYCPTAHFIMASSSSVYGCDSESPFDETQAVCNRPLSVYAASKKSTEMFAQSYHLMYQMPITMFRFFTVYGERNRPDMAVYKFIEALVNGTELPVFGDGSAYREFTYIDDIINGLMASVRKGFGGGAINKEVKIDDALILNSQSTTTTTSSMNNLDDFNSNQSTVSSSDISESGKTCINHNEGVEVFNIGGGSTHTVMELIHTIERAVGQKAKLKFLEEQLGDVPFTIASQHHVKAELGFEPKVSLDEGIKRTVEWYQQWRMLRDSITSNQYSTNT